MTVDLIPEKGCAGTVCRPNDLPQQVDVIGSDEAEGLWEGPCPVLSGNTRATAPLQAVDSLNRSVLRIAQSIQAAKGLHPEVARAAFSLQRAPAFHGGTVRLEPPVHNGQFAWQNELLWVLGLATAIPGSLALIQRRNETRLAIIIAEKPTLRLTPFPEANAAGTPAPGQHILPIETRNGWCYLTLAGTTLRGWLQENEIEALIPKS